MSINQEISRIREQQTTFCLMLFQFEIIIDFTWLGTEEHVWVALVTEKHTTVNDTILGRSRPEQSYDDAHCNDKGTGTCS